MIHVPATNNIAELMRAMHALSVKVSLIQADEMVKELDVNARGAIQLPQFIILMERHTQVGKCPGVLPLEEDLARIL